MLVRRGLPPGHPQVDGASVVGQREEAQPLLPQTQQVLSRKDLKGPALCPEGPLRAE